MAENTGASTAKIVLYDVRGIQDYIFRNNKIREIIGASDIIKDIYDKGLKEAAKKCNIELTLDQDNAFSFNEEKNMVLYIGGGNALFYFKNEEDAKKVSNEFSRYVLEHTYSLNLAVAMVNYTGKYKEDYDNVIAEMKRVMAKMPYCKPIGAFSLCLTEDSTGLPRYTPHNKKFHPNSDLSSKDVMRFRTHISRETYIKLLEFDKNKKALTDKVKRLKKEAKKAGKNFNDKKLEYDLLEYDEKLLDKIIYKHKDSTLAIIHIDGNNMGVQFQEIFSDSDENNSKEDNQSDYGTFVPQVRKKSKEIDNLYNKTFERLKEKLHNLSDTEAYKEKILIRKIITAGDDITFIINGQFAFDAVKFFLEEIEKGRDDSNVEKHQYTACAGIAFSYSHFPFSEAYKVAEELCASAKKKAKKYEEVRSAVDFQVLSHMKASFLDEYRENQFTFKDGEDTYKLLRRPYILERETDGDDIKAIGYSNFIELLENLNKQKIVRSDIIEIRNSYHKGINSLKSLANKYASRGKTLISNSFVKSGEGCDSNDLSYSKVKFFDEYKIAYYYDAFEIFDKYKNIEEEINKNNNDKSSAKEAK